MLIGMLNGVRVMASKRLIGKQCYCPVCGEKLILKTGKIKVSHFAHEKASDCATSEGETSEHLLGKRQIFDWLSQSGFNPQYEVYLKAIQQRPDLLITDHTGQKIAIEFQCSPLPLERLQQRNRGYRQLAIKVWWILGAPYLNRQLSRAKMAQFVQRVKADYNLLFWSTRVNRLLVRPLPRQLDLVSSKRVYDNSRQLIAQQTLTIQQMVLRGDRRVKKLQQLCYGEGQNLMGCPISIHFTRATFSLVTGSTTLWQVKLILMLDHFALGSHWLLADWYCWLNEISQGDWLELACVDNQKVIRYKAMKQFTKQLMNANILDKRGQYLYYVCRPVWFRDATQKLMKLGGKGPLHVD